MPTPWPVSIASLTRASCGAVVWRAAGDRQLTVIVKATFSLVDGGEARLAAPLDVVRADGPGGDARSLEEPSDTAPYLPSAGVHLRGHAQAPAGTTAKALAVRLTLSRDDERLLDKGLHVLGDRTPQGRAPFARMPLVYERALGGPGVLENPVGTTEPNIVDPVSPARPTGLAPVARTWAPRAALQGWAGEPDGLAPDLPEDFDYRYFHAAPADQQIDYLRGDEQIVLEGMRAEQPWIRCRLPGARGVARLYRTGEGRGEEQVDLVADTLSIDADRLLVSIVWRGLVPLRPEEALARLHVLAGVELPGRPVAWPDLEAIVRFAGGPPSSGSRRATDTVELGRGAGAVGTLAPFPLAPPRPSARTLAPLPAAPWRDAEPAEGRRPLLRTEPPAAPGEHALPFALPGLPAPPLGSSWKPGPPPLRTAAWSALDDATADLQPQSTQELDSLEVQLSELQDPETAEARPATGEHPEVDADEPEPITLSRARLAALRRAEGEGGERGGAEGTGRAEDAAAASEATADPATISLPPPPPAREPEARGVRAIVVARLANGEPLQDLELAGVSLDGVDFSGASLEHVRFVGSGLSRCNFAGARLARADLGGADLTDAIFTGADLTFADLSRAMIDRARLDDADLTGATLSRAKGACASFARAKLGRVDLRQARLLEATFDGAGVAGANAHKADLSLSSFRDADLAGANLRGARLRGAILSGASLDGADLRDADLAGATVRGAALASARTGGAVLRDLVEAPGAAARREDSA